MTREAKPDAVALDEIAGLYRRLASAGSISDEHAWAMFDTVAAIVRETGRDVGGAPPHRLTPDGEIEQ